MKRPDFSARTYPVVQVLDVHDADTMKLLADRGGHDYWGEWFRLKGYSAAELNTDAGKLATVFAAALVNGSVDAGTLWIVTHRAQRPFKVKRFQDDDMTFGRYLAEVWLADDDSLGERLVAAGHARPGSFIG